MIKKAYLIDKETKTITIDDSIKQTDNDRADIQMYVVAGYIIRHKSRARSAAALKRSDNITADQCRQALKGTKKALTEFERIISEKGFFSAKKYYKDWLAEQSAATAAEKPKRRGRKPKTETVTQKHATETATTDTETQATATADSED